uniref:MATH domain-containing protein n=1 Tax=Panagrolaimus davidi TaxID=227884 RepID=A0A914R2H7_9BILA
MADASLYFEEAVAERELEPIGENISFTHGWVIRVPNGDEEQRLVQTSFGTNYKFGTCEWNVRLCSRRSPFGLTNLGQGTGQRSKSYILVETARRTKIPGGSCHIAYTIYYDNDMRYELYSSTKVATIGMVTDGLRFRTPRGNFMEMLTNAFIKNEGKMIVVFIEMILPTRFFFRRFEDLSIFAHHKLPEYPAHIEDDFRFDFINNG